MILPLVIIYNNEEHNDSAELLYILAPYMLREV